MWKKLLQLMGKGVKWGVKNPDKVAKALKVVKAIKK